MLLSSHIKNKKTIILRDKKRISGNERFSHNLSVAKEISLNFILGSNSQKGEKKI